MALLMMACRNDAPPQSEGTAVVEESKETSLLARAADLELPTTYTAPPGDPLSHHAAGFAKVLCSGVFITGLDAGFVADAIGYFSAPYEERSKFADFEIDHHDKSVTVILPNGIGRTAILTEGNGCVCLGEGEHNLHYTSKKIGPELPDADLVDWPMGDRLSSEALPPGVNAERVEEAVNAIFEHEDALTAALVITYRGQIIGERYRNGINMHTPLESWSMGKSLTATLVGILIQQGVYTLDQPAPIPEWQEAGDDRAKIKIQDILRMSSGLRFRAPQDPDFDPEVGYPDHLYVYTQGENSFAYSATRPQQWPPNTVGRYRNCDPSLANYLVRLGVEGRGDDYHAFPQRALFDKIGVRNMVIETDPYGNFLLQGYEFAPARDWARIGNLYLQDGVWNGERILPEGFVKFVSSVAPAWEADDRPIYGGFFWINTEKTFNVPADAYFMAGAGGQFTIIVPSHDLVIVKMSHYKGAAKSMEDLNRGLEILMGAVPGQEI